MTLGECGHPADPNDICDDCQPNLADHITAVVDPTEADIIRAISTLAATERYSVRDNETDDWIA